MNCVCSADRVRSGFAQPNVTNLSFLDESTHGADGILDRNLRIDTMQIVEINGFHLEPSQEGFTANRHIFGAGIDVAAFCPGLAAQITELRCKHDLIALALECLDEEFFIVAIVVIGRIDEAAEELRVARCWPNGLKKWSASVHHLDLYFLKQYIPL
jgi:hypothetical protein